MKKILILTLSVMFLIVGATLWAQEEGHGRAASVIIDEIKQNQGVASLSLIDADQVNPALLEELGDAVMGLMIGDERQHQWMDEMLGGEGSEQLASTHRWIGYNYLRNNGNLSTWGPHMMGNRNLNWPNRDWGYSSGGMMGWSGNWWGWIVITVIIIVIVVVLVALFLALQVKSKGSHDALDILRSRYAEGKISREEYQQISKELKK